MIKYLVTGRKLWSILQIALAKMTWMLHTQKTTAGLISRIITTPTTKEHLATLELGEDTAVMKLHACVKALSSNSQNRRYLSSGATKPSSSSRSSSSKKRSNSKSKKPSASKSSKKVALKKSDSESEEDSSDDES